MTAAIDLTNLGDGLREGLAPWCLNCACEATCADSLVSTTEFKEIRKEWKARKKAEEAERKTREEEQQRAAQAQGQNDPQGGHDGQQPAVTQYGGARLPPIGYQPTQYPAPPNVSMANEYSSNYIAAGGYNPTSPYQQSHQQVYGQRTYAPGGA